jgi:hypothetical protein
VVENSGEAYIVPHWEHLCRFPCYPGEPGFPKPGSNASCSSEYRGVGFHLSTLCHIDHKPCPPIWSVPMGHEKYRGGVCGASGQNPSDREGGVPSG